MPPIDAITRSTAAASSMSMATARVVPPVTLAAASSSLACDRLSMITRAPRAAAARAVASPIPELAPTTATV
ncbi:hypothetical protein WME91_09340 [Sorangium sp. So ce269]